MKPMIAVPLAFIVGVGSTTGFAVATHKSAPTPATVAAPIDSAAPTPRQESTDSNVVPPDSAVAEPPAPVADSMPAAPDTLAARSPATDLSRAAGTLGRLGVEDAAALVALMNDDNAARLLRTLGIKRSAPILARLGQSRAATLSRRLLTLGQSDEGEP